MRLSPGYYVFVVKEYADGKPWIMMERRDQGLEVLKRGFIGFDSQDGTSSIEAEKLAAALNALIKNVSCTAPPEMIGFYSLTTTDAASGEI